MVSLCLGLYGPCQKKKMVGSKAENTQSKKSKKWAHEQVPRYGEARAQCTKITILHLLPEKFVEILAKGNDAEKSMDSVHGGGKKRVLFLASFSPFHERESL